MIHPVDQMVDDFYGRNKEISNDVTYQLDSMTSTKPNSTAVNTVQLFDHIKIQVDGWQCVTLGVTTIAEVVAVIDKANEDYVTKKTNAVIAERQAAIDAEYEAAVKNAEEKGKKYDKSKKEVRTDDIHFDNPYSYVVRFGGHTKEGKEYQPTLLVNPSSTKMLCLSVYKYGIPYVVFDFHTGGGQYVSGITQASEWVMNGVEAESLKKYASSKKGAEAAKIATIMDVDGRNKIAKKNIYMSGNITFGGDGFTWDSLITLCNALNLEEGGSYNSFKRSSDSNFTYYTIILTTNAFNANPELLNEAKVTFPCVKLVATFDPLTQVCINWTMEAYSKKQTFSNKNHALDDATNINVHEYIVDTNDYEGMRQTIQDWIDKNALKTSTAYVAIDEKNGKMFGKVDTGAHNATIEMTVDGVVYKCLEYSIKYGDVIVGLYISEEDFAEVEKLGDTSEAAAYVAKHAKNLRIACCVLDKSDNIVGSVAENYAVLLNSNGKYHIVDFEHSDLGFNHVKILTTDLAEQLLLTYAKTYRLTAEQNEVMHSVFETQGLMGVRDYINDLFAETEANQKKD